MTTRTSLPFFLRARLTRALLVAAVCHLLLDLIQVIALTLRMTATRPPRNHLTTEGGAEVEDEEDPVETNGETKEEETIHQILQFPLAIGIASRGPQANRIVPFPSRGQDRDLNQKVGQRGNHRIRVSKTIPQRQRIGESLLLSGQRLKYNLTPRERHRLKKVWRRRRREGQVGPIPYQADPTVAVRVVQPEAVNEALRHSEGVRERDHIHVLLQEALPEIDLAEGVSRRRRAEVQTGAQTIFKLVF